MPSDTTDIDHARCADGDDREMDTGVDDRGDARAHADRHNGQPPSSHDWLRSGGSAWRRAKHPHYSTVIRLFGSWNAAVRAAGFTPRPRGPQTAWTKELAVAAIREHAARNGGVPPTAAVWERPAGEPGEPGAHPGWSTVASLFGYWAEAIRTAGFTPPKGRERAPAGTVAGWTRASVIAALQHWAAADPDGLPPAVSDWQRRGAADGTLPAHPNAHTGAALFGSWTKGVHAAGLKQRASGRRSRWTRESFCAALREYAAANGGQAPRARDWEHAAVAPIAHPTAQLAQPLFGSWANAVQAAGLEPAPPRRSHSRWTRGDIIAAIRHLRRRHRAPAVGPRLAPRRHASRSHRHRAALRFVVERVARSGFASLTLLPSGHIEGTATSAGAARSGDGHPQ
jgi:Homing endonuclease associated repeat